MIRLAHAPGYAARIGPLLLLACSPMAALADEAADIVSAIAGGTPGVFARYRYEFVDQDSFDENANA